MLAERGEEDRLGVGEVTVGCESEDYDCEEELDRAEDEDDEVEHFFFGFFWEGFSFGFGVTLFLVY